MTAPAACETCVLGLAECWARSTGHARLCEHARAGRADYVGLIRARSDPAYRPPPAPPREAPPPPPPPMTVNLPDCPDRGPKIDDAGCLTFMCNKFTRVVSGCECARCSAAGFAYVG